MGSNQGKIHIYEPGLEELVKRNIEQGRLSFSTNLAEGIEDALFILNCVGTPSKPEMVLAIFHTSIRWHLKSDRL
jgi:UDPglucose 6-dehydrogenase